MASIDPPPPVVGRVEHHQALALQDAQPLAAPAVRFRAVEPEDGPVEVTVYGRDAQDAQVATKALRFLLYRDAGPSLRGEAGTCAPAVSTRRTTPRCGTDSSRPRRTPPGPSRRWRPIVDREAGWKPMAAR